MGVPVNDGVCAGHIYEDMRITHDPRRRIEKGYNPRARDRVCQEI